jgi:O-succinylbenzoic acid--CoA ligase
MSIDNKFLLLNGNKIAFGKLKEENLADYDSHERSVISFCRQWIEGHSEFEAQTSGSTGIPKKIILLRQQMAASARLTEQALQLHEDMTAMLCLDPDLIAGKMMMVRCMVTGMDLLAIKPVANPLDHIPPGVSVDFAAMVPLQVTTVLASGRHRAFANIGVVIIGGGAVSNALYTAIQSLPTHFVATFGMTETLSHVALQSLNGPNRTEYFEALPGVQFSTDDRGCLIVHAPYLGSNPIITNDVIEIKSPTRFKWLGRWDNVINTGGVKVVPEEVEQIVSEFLSARSASNRFFVTGLPHPTLGQEVLLIVEGTLEERVETALLMDLKATLDKHKAPRKVLYAEKFALTALGKIRRRESAQAASPRPGQGSGAGPVSGTGPRPVAES